MGPYPRGFFCKIRPHKDKFDLKSDKLEGFFAILVNCHIVSLSKIANSQNGRRKVSIYSDYNCYFQHIALRMHIYKFL